MKAKPKSKLPAIRKALADYIASEGCSCCQDKDTHDEAAKRLAKLLNVKKYEDGSGYDFYRYKTKKQPTHG